MKKFFNYLTVLLFSSLIVLACSDKDNPPDPDPTPETNEYKYVNDWILENMSFWYLWNDKIPTNADNTKKPGDYFQSLLYNYGNNSGDRFSWIQENFVDLLNSLSGVSKEAGYDYELHGYNPNGVFGFVTYIKPDSPAAAAGLKRGDFFWKINNVSMTQDNYRTLIGQLSDNHTLGLATIGGGYINDGSSISLEVKEYHESPIFYDNVYTINNKKIGYLVYNFFSPNDGDGSIKYDKALNEVFGKFKTNNINDLILDLRYNGGGSVSSAIYLASMIVKNLNTNNILIKRKYNSVAQSEIIAYYGEEFLIDRFKNKIERYDSNDNVLESINLQNVNLPRVYIIASWRTASASELIINGLKPYMDVYLIGGKTVGKNVASISIYEDNDPKNKWGMQPIVSKITNSTDFAEFEMGFQPDVEIDERSYFGDIKPLGDKNEAILAAALEYITTGAAPVKVQKKSIATGDAIRLQKDNRGMYLDSKSLPKFE
ncbi:MAG: hypothetical protein LBL90_00875 [Prevotellaceae bacterium]|jgi:C-terminal processing protease CtpA/Prc|nr:hypothetical protein [Prevotellaceae bacterium]